MISIGRSLLVKRLNFPLLFSHPPFPSSSSSRESSLTEDKVKNLLLEKDAKISSMQAEIAKVSVSDEVKPMLIKLVLGYLVLYVFVVEKYVVSRDSNTNNPQHPHSSRIC